MLRGNKEEQAAERPVKSNTIKIPQVGDDGGNYGIVVATES